MSWQCIFLNSTLKGKAQLRRYTLSESYKCPNHGNWGHKAIVPMSDVDIILDGKGYIRNSIEFNVLDPNIVWPEACACGYKFQTSDYKTLDVDRYYSGPNGLITTLREAPIASMWDADWMHGIDLYCREGISLHLKLPGNGEWCIDGPSQQTPNGKGWTRTGTPPLITASPSIHWPGVYHGWLQNGVLSDDIDGKKF